MELEESIDALIGQPSFELDNISVHKYEPTDGKGRISERAIRIVGLR